jgi:hypothetical protein
MCSGLPVVAARAGGIPEMIQDEVSGYLYDTDKEAADRIGELLQSKHKRETMGAQARAHASGRGWRNATETLIEYYQEALEMQTFRRVPEANSRSNGLRAKTGRVIRRAIMLTLRRLLP